MTILDQTAALPKARIDYVPLLLPLLMALVALPLIHNPTTWVTLTIAGLAMGMMTFIMASGLTLVFGLMDVLNFGHGAFISIGGYLAVVFAAPLALWLQGDSLGLELAGLAIAAIAAVLAAGLIGLAFERLLIVPVYGQHLKQILVTMGGLIVAQQLLQAMFGAALIPLSLPPALRGSLAIGDVTIEKYRFVAIIVGLVVFAAMTLALNRTRIGLLIRAGVENAEMVEALGYRIDALFVGVFMAGSAFAALGGLMWSFYRGSVDAFMGSDMMVTVFIVVIIGGLGSIGGCFVASLLVALLTNYAGFLVPKVALVSDILLMALVLLWRPRGFYPVTMR